MLFSDDTDCGDCSGLGSLCGDGKDIFATFESNFKLCVCVQSHFLFGFFRMHNPDLHREKDDRSLGHMIVRM